MIKHTKLGGIWAGLLVAFAAGCTQYIGANEPQPQILGVTVASAYSAFTQPAPGWCSVSFETCSSAGQDCSGYCSTSTLESCVLDGDCGGSCSVTTTYGCSADADCPGFCAIDNARFCSMDDDCAPGDTCDLTSGQTCDLTPQTCVGAHGSCSSTTGLSCLADTDCQGHCTLNTTTPCLTDAGCTGGTDFCVTTPAQTCDLPGTCSTTTTTQCAVNSQCPAGEHCNNSTASTAPGGLLQTCNYPGTGIPTDAYNWPYPPREGPVFEYNFTGGSVPPQATWSLGVASSNPGFNLPGGVPSGPWPSPRYGPYLFARPRLIFNKLLDGPSIQPDPTACGAGPLTVTATPAGGPTADVTADFGVCYDPSSPTTAYGASVFLMPPASGRLRSDTTYHITGSIKDKPGNLTDVDFTIQTAP